MEFGRLSHPEMGAINEEPVAKPAQLPVLLFMGWSQATGPA
jgi:hypothetical protein